MDFISFLSSAASGGIVGSILHMGTSAFDVWRKGKEVDQNIKMMEAQSASTEKMEAWKAFTESQKTQGAIAIPENAHPWVSNFYLAVDGITRLTRPALTWAAVAFIATVYLKASPAARDTLATEINFGAWTIMYWWFGARYQKK